MNKRGLGFPKWVYKTKRIFQRKKRADMRAFERALTELRMGCAFCPGYDEHWRPMEQHFNALKESWRPANWK